MEIKKATSADLEPKKKYFFQVGLIISLLLTVVLFSWSQPKKEIEVMVEEAPIIEQEFTEITVQEDKRPPAPIKTQAVTISDVIKIVKNDTKISQDMTIFDMDVTDQVSAVDVSKYGGTYTGEESVEDEETPVVISEDPPKFQGGGIDAFRKWVQTKLVYPPAALDNNVEGKVLLQFIIERDGSVSNVKVLRGANRDLDAEAVKVVSSSPKWTPGRNRGKPVRVYVNIPVDFVLGE